MTGLSMRQSQTELHYRINEDWKLTRAHAQGLTWLQGATATNSFAKRNSLLSMQREKRLGKDRWWLLKIMFMLLITTR